jgi:tetratricopeptide (TPR) repeat protein
LIFALGNLMRKSDSNKHYFFWLPVLCALFAVHVMIGFQGVWIGLALALVLLLIFSISRLDEMRVGWLSVAFAMMIISILFAFLGTPRFLRANLPTEISLSHGTSWQISRDTITANFKQFLFGSGPATFVNDFSKERTEDFNNTIAWNVRFLHPFNNFLELLATTGVLGAIAFIILLLSAVGASFASWFKMPTLRPKRMLDGVKEVLSRDTDNSQLYFLILTGWLLLVVSVFLNSWSTVHWWLFYWFLALLFALPFEIPGVYLKKLSLKTSPQYSLVSSFVTILVFTGVVVLGVYLGMFYAAEVYVKAGSSTGNINQAVQSFGKAMNLSKGRYQYHLRLAESYITRASEELGRGSPNPDLISQLVAEAVNEARIATDLSSRNVMAWEFLATMYENARALTGEAVRFQVSALEKAIELDPTNPLLQMSLGNAKLAVGNVAEARDKFKESVRLKPNFIPGYTSLSLLEEAQGNIVQAIEYMATAASVAPNDPVTVYNLGRLYYNRAGRDDLARAEQLFLIAVQLNPGYSDALWSLGLLNERRGNTSEALRYYRKVQTLNPGNTDVKAKLQTLAAPPPEDKKK